MSDESFGPLQNMKIELMLERELDFHKIVVFEKLSNMHRNISPNRLLESIRSLYKSLWRGRQGPLGRAMGFSVVPETSDIDVGNDS